MNYSSPAVDVYGNHACACSVLSLDAMDVSGEQQIDIDANLFKERLNLEGTPINPDSPEKHGKYCRLPPAYFIRFRLFCFGTTTEIL